jgi:hypothetical protein
MQFAASLKKDFSHIEQAVIEAAIEINGLNKEATIAFLKNRYPNLE